MTARQESLQGKVMTVTGPIDADAMGITLPHEHLLLYHTPDTVILTDPEVAVILLDVVLGYGAHPDPASELAPAIESAIKTAHDEDRKLVVVAVVVGTDEDPQDLCSQIDQLKEQGVKSLEGPMVLPVGKACKRVLSAAKYEVSLSEEPEDFGNGIDMYYFKVEF